MGLRTTAAVTLGKLSGAASRQLGRGGGSALPGLLAQTVDREIVRHLASQLSQGSILITGTNGKTTTSRMLATILHQAGLSALHNRSGSNLMRGVATTLIGQAGLGGSLAVAPRTVGLFEVDEFVLPQAVREIAPRVIVFNNLFRDQLDRYGEVDLISGRWGEAIRRLPPEGVAVLNADDPTVAALGQGQTSRVLYYGIDDDRHALPGLEHAADSKWCPRCNVSYHYRLSFYGHIGHYACPQCEWRRPTPQVRAVRLDLRGLQGTDIDLETPAGNFTFRLGLPGLYNVYNALAATAAALALGIPASVVRDGLEKVTAAFGRVERLAIAGKTVYLLLAKNPTGLNQVIRALLSEPGTKNLLFMLNDNIADGRDVSWIWDVDFERLAGQVRSLVCSGVRAEDIALRLKLAGVFGAPVPVGTAPGAHSASVEGQGTRGLEQGTRNREQGIGARDDLLQMAAEGVVERDTGPALDRALAQTEPGGTLFVVPTYTAMLDLRKELVRRGHVRDFLESN